ncbi:MAG: heme exporter protein CcmB [Rhodospirillaceae bacterium]|nr:MAG: heme exporter protein CcmB [Rhodospirillaceae bacterium]
MNRFTALLRRELRLAYRQASDSATAVLFFLLGALLFPFGVGPEAEILARIAAGVIWVMALLAAMLSLEQLFQADFEDGSLELLVIAPVPLEAIVLAKCLAHWLTTGLPLLIAAPILALLLNLPISAIGTMELALLLGTPVLSFLGAVGAALVLGARRGGVLLALLLLPLLVPVLIFGVAAVDAAIQGTDPTPRLAVLGGFLVLALAFSPWVSAATLRQALE